MAQSLRPSRVLWTGSRFFSVHGPHGPSMGIPPLKRENCRSRYLHSNRSNASSQTLASSSASAVQLQSTNTIEESSSEPTKSHRRNASPLSRLSTVSLLRSLFLGYCFTSPRLLKVLMGAMGFIAHSKSPFLDPDRNPVVGRIMRALVYDHFCAGTTPPEVKRTITEIKKTGYAGVILGYGRELVVDPGGGADGAGKELERADSRAAVAGKHIQFWLDGNMTTLGMIGENDYMNVKFTGAGPFVSQCLIDGSQPPEALTTAIDTICNQARSQGSRIWIDAEQQIFQPAIDAWTTDLMRRHNIHGDTLVYTTIQTYLKSSRETVAKYLQAASDEGWTLGIKQVRGAYIASDVRDRIWDTKAQTDDSYNSIARDLLGKNTAAGTFPGFKAPKFPNLHLFLAGHNTESIKLATAFVRELTMAGKEVPHVQYGQLHGMADDVSCDLVEQYETAVENLEKHRDEGKAVSAKYELDLRAAPVVYKCLNWGSVQECIHFLLRRAVENATAAERIKNGLPELRAEFKRRLLRRA